MSQPMEIVRASVANLEIAEILKKSPSNLIGVSKSAATSLSKLGIKTIFDLGTSNIFASARAIMEMAQTGTASCHLGLFCGDFLNDNANYSNIPDIPKLGINKLRTIPKTLAAELADSLAVTTIRDLALWPPHLAARRLVGESAGSTIDPEELQTEELRPRMGQYPTERVYYNSLILLQMLGQPGQLKELSGPLSLDPAIRAGVGLTRPAIGALLTFSQSWYAQGVTLGHMLHSLALAPGEATRIAVIDWSRRTRAATTESISEAEQLDDAASHSRSLSEIQQAVARDYQRGGSYSNVSSGSGSASVTHSSSTGFLTSVFESDDMSETGQAAFSGTEATSSGWSIGNRSIFGSMAQNVNDRTEQHASSVRSRRASAVREVSQSEHEQVSTRIVANYNHMHALTIQYYEVVQVYRTEAKLHQAERCLFLPLQLLDFSWPHGWRTVERFRGALLKVALNSRVRSILLDDTTAVSIAPPPELAISFLAFRPDLRKVTNEILAKYMVRPHVFQVEKSDKTTFARNEKLKAIAPHAIRVWDETAIATASKILDRPLMRANSNALHVPDETELISVSFDNVSVDTVRFDHVEVAGDNFTVPTNSGHVALPRGIPLLGLKAIHVKKAAEAEETGSMTLTCLYFGRQVTLPAIPLDLKGKNFQTVALIYSDQSDRRKELLQHFHDNREYYSRAAFRSLDSGAITAILSDYQWNGKSLADIVEPRPVQLAGNYLILRAPVFDDEDSGLKVDGNPASWKDYLESRGLELEQPSDARLIPIPTGGVFAEAVLGRANSAEKLDITRFWNWQDSPIPLTPTEISPIATGSRREVDDLTPGQLGQPVFNIVNPTALPDPAGLGTVLNAIANPNMFRDMSGLAGTQGMTREAMANTLKAATDAGQLASANMATEAQKSVAMGQIFADLAKSAISAMTGAPLTGGGSSQSSSTKGAEINHARDMDERGVPVPGSGGQGAAGGTDRQSGGRTSVDAGGTPSTPTSQVGGGSKRSRGRRSHEGRAADPVGRGVESARDLQETIELEEITVTPSKFTAFEISLNDLELPTGRIPTSGDLSGIRTIENYMFTGRVRGIGVDDTGRIARFVGSGRAEAAGLDIGDHEGTGRVRVPAIGRLELDTPRTLYEFNGTPFSLCVTENLAGTTVELRLPRLGSELVWEMDAIGLVSSLEVRGSLEIVP